MSTHDDEEPIRPVTEQDADRIAEIYGHYVLHTAATFDTEPPSATQWRERIRTQLTDGLPFLVLERGGRVIGYAYVAPWSPRPAYRHTVETTIYLEPKSTGAGRGRRLMKALSDSAQAVGIRELIARIAESGDGASLALHRRLGFRDVGTLDRVGYKFDHWIDTHLLQRSLGER